MYTEDGIMGSLVMAGIRVIGTVDGMLDIGAVFVHGDLIIGIIHTGATAVIGAQTLTGAGVMPTTTHGFITVLDGDITATTALGISTIMATPLSQTEGAQIKIDWSQEAAQIAQIWGHVSNQVLEGAVAVI
jgi:hypothetical protein